MPKTCNYCGIGIPFFGHKVKLADRRGNRLGLACAACYSDFSKLAAELVYEAQEGEAPWLPSAPQWEISFSKRPGDTQVVSGAVQRLSTSFRHVSPIAAKIFTQYHSVFVPNAPITHFSKSEACVEIGKMMWADIKGTRSGDDWFSISLHPSARAMLLSDTFGENTRYRHHQTCYLLDSQYSVHSFYMYHR